MARRKLRLCWTCPGCRPKGLLERVVANVVENAVRYSRQDEPVLVSASAIADRVELRVVDRGPGVPDGAKERVFEPFQRYGDGPRGAGVGLGLAVARGFAEAMGGTINAEDTPGGGLTTVLCLRRARGGIRGSRGYRPGSPRSGSICWAALPTHPCRRSWCQHPVSVRPVPVSIAS